MVAILAHGVSSRAHRAFYGLGCARSRRSASKVSSAACGSGQHAQVGQHRIQGGGLGQRHFDAVERASEGGGRGVEVARPVLDHAQEQGAARIARLELDEPLELRSRFGGPIARLQHETELVVRLGDLRSRLEARPVGELGVGERAARRQNVAEEEVLRRSPRPELARAR